jgi:hypothetical protein
MRGGFAALAAPLATKGYSHKKGVDVTHTHTHALSHCLMHTTVYVRIYGEMQRCACVSADCRDTYVGGGGKERRGKEGDSKKREGEK